VNGRITAYAIQSNGSRSYGIVVRGVKILITADESQYEVAEKLAFDIAELGPVCVSEHHVKSPAPEDKPSQIIPARRSLVEGQIVWCRVHGSKGFCKITEVGTGRNGGCIKISGVRGWCPDSNFLDEEPR